MNPDSRKKGVKGKVRPKHPSVDPVTPVAAKPKSAEGLNKVREQALGGLTDLVGAALGVLGDCLKNGPSRAQGSRSSDARYVLDVVLDRISAPEVPEDVDLDEDGQPLTTPIDELAERRAELQKLLRAQRRDMDRNKQR